MEIESSFNCCINIWDNQEDNIFDVYVVFPTYVGHQPVINGTLELLEKAYEETDGMESCEEVREYIAVVLEENNIDYLDVSCRER